jgi:hypothetical protein
MAVFEIEPPLRRERLSLMRRGARDADSFVNRWTREPWGRRTTTHRQGEEGAR